jgi:hypothetical protein
MSDKITEPVTPEVLDPVPPAPLAGDWHDDDAQVYADDFIAADHGPDKFLGVPHTAAEIDPTTRLLTRNGQVGTINGVQADPIMLLPADPNRKTLTVLAYADTKLTVIIASSKSECFNGTTFLTVAGGGVVTVPLDGHTGAVWAYSAAAAAVDITALAVTR